MKRLLKNFAFTSGLVLTVALVLGAVAAPVLAPYDPSQQFVRRVEIYPGGPMRTETRLREEPTQQHLLGLDELGRDVLSRILFGARVSLRVGFSVVLLASLVGVAFGAIAGYFGGWIDLLVMRLCDILLAFPGILLAIALVAVLGPSLNNVILALSIIGWVGYARLVRGQVLKVREMEYVTAAKALGAKSPRVILRHVLPNVINPVIVMATLGLAGAILSEAALSFLGLGVQPPTPSWGSMLAYGRRYLGEANHLAIFPGAAIMLAVMGLNFLGDGLIDALDPKYRKLIR
ncbi:MAG TPA: ABC transporter permease [Thermoanaerobaculia bacterium]|nr:ABC transporter permease [Thermoanaerobaculia bacterium]